jgi:hypothetical protein
MEKSHALKAKGEEELTTNARELSHFETCVAESGTTDSKKMYCKMCSPMLAYM